MAEPYRFGGPTLESVKRLKSRREFRASSLYARMKRGLGEKFEEERAEAMSPRILPPLDGQSLCPPAESPPAA